MEIQYRWNGKIFISDLNQGTDISISFKEGFDQVNCFYAPFFTAQPVKSGDFTGSIALGGPVNFYNSFINIHGGGTHTEGVGHIDAARQSVNQIIKQFFGVALLVSVYPTKMENGDRAIRKESLMMLMDGLQACDFLILRSLPNQENKKQLHYSGTNPPFIDAEAMQWICASGYKHLLVDLPSVDQEVDGGKLASHHVFWQGERSNFCTITELIYVPDQLKDGYFLINLQVAAIESDACPSRPILFPMREQ